MRFRLCLGALVAPALLALAACGTPPPAGPSPAEKRLAVIKGEATGIVLIPARSPSAAAAPGPAASGATPGAAPAAPPRAGLALDLPPPTGLPPGQIKKLDRPELGIPLPSSLSASQPKR